MNLNLTDYMAEYEALPWKARERILDRIISTMSRTELRRVLTFCNEEIAHFDILGKLPLELVILVAKELSLVDILRLQRVSRRWKLLLSSSTVQSAVVKPYFPNDRIDDPAKYLERRIRIEEGIFTAQYDLDLGWDGLDGPPCMLSPDYCSGRVGWIRNFRREMAVLDLRDGSYKKYCPNDGNDLLCMKMSKNLAVALGETYCYVWNFVTGDRVRFEPPKPLVQGAFLVSGTNVILQAEGCLIYWGWITQRAFLIHWQNMANIRKLILDPHEDKFTIIYLSNTSDRVDGELEAILGKKDLPCNVEVHIDSYVLTDGVFRTDSERTENIFLRHDTFVHGSKCRCALGSDGIEVNVQKEHFFRALPRTSQVISHSHGFMGTGLPDIQDDPIGEIRDGPDEPSYAKSKNYVGTCERLLSLDAAKFIVHKAWPKNTSLLLNKHRFVSPAPGILYVTNCCRNRPSAGVKTVEILRADSLNGPVREYFFHKELREERHQEMFGDEDFMVFIDDYTISIRSFKDGYDPRYIGWPGKHRPRWPEPFELNIDDEIEVAT